MAEIFKIDESERLAALARLDLMDTPDEPEFDELVHTAAAICGTPMSLVTLLDERRQWFKAAYGVSLRETPRDVSFCAHTIQHADGMQVEDALLDPRFADNLNVLGDVPIRFYAGVPIQSANGQPLGTLCVLDHVARQLSTEQFEALRVLGFKANARLALREQRLTLQRTLTATEEANARLLEMATTDSLTGLYNRRAFQERLSVEFAVARRSGRPLSLLMIDLDNFKQRNDQHGHVAGDKLLVQFARLLHNSVRETDLAVRYGGEEFVVLLPDTTCDGALHLGERILAKVREAVWPLEPVTASVGCSTLTDEMADASGMLVNADEALYAAKKVGKDCIVCGTIGSADAPAATS